MVRDHVDRGGEGSSDPWLQRKSQHSITGIGVKMCLSIYDIRGDRISPAQQ